jgi:hypothetical protein
MLGACNDSTTASSSDLLLASAFNSTPAGFDAVQSSFTGAAATDFTGGPGMPWMPRHDGRGHDHFFGGPGFGDFMGGGVGLGFLGGLEVGHGIGHGPFGDDTVSSTCAFSATTGDVTCAPETRDGITIVRIAAYKTAAGVAQGKADSTTNSARMRITASGTRTRRDSATAILSNTSDRTVTGLANGSAFRMVNGRAGGTETTSGTNSAGSFVSIRVTSDTVSSVKIPVVDNRPTYPTAGTVVRTMKVTTSVAGGTPATSTRREVITYDGSTTAKVVITHDDSTRTCSLPLPRGRLTCH